MQLAPESLRGRLLLTGLAGTALSALLVAWLLGMAFERAVLGAFDRNLQEDMLTLVAQLTADANGRAQLRGEPVDSRFRRVFSGHYWVIRHPGGVLHSRSLWDAQLVLPRVRSGSEPVYVSLDGPLDQQLRGISQALRIPRVEHPVQVLVATDVGATAAEIARFRLQAGLAAALVGVILLLVFATQARLALRPLRRMATALQQLQAGQASRLPAQRLPTEVRPLGEALNGMLQHGERMVARARAAAADLAHGLKTPLSVLQVAAERHDADLAQVVQQQVGRMRGSIDRQLATAALGHALSRTEVAPVAAALTAMLLRVHATRELRIDTQVPGDLLFLGERADLEDMLGNLLDNACKWARGQVVLRAALSGDRVVISVSDDGPGIPASQRDAAVARGVRLDEHAPGSGLGLSIVAGLAESHGGSLRLEEAQGGGLQATLDLPGARQLPGAPAESIRG